MTESTATSDARFSWYADSGHEAGLEVSGFSSHSRPSWADETYADIVTDYSEWEMRLGSQEAGPFAQAPRSSIFACALDAFTSDAMAVYRRAIGMFGDSSWP